VGAGARPGVAAVLRQEETDVVALGGAGDERRLHVHDGRVAHERAGVDDAARHHLERRDGHVVRRAVVLGIRQVIDARLGAAGNGRSKQQGKRYCDPHGGAP
jgi:hypothetical protein